MEKLKRYLVFFIGLYINSLGVAMITKAALGTSPISSIPYVLSLQFPFSLGEFTIFFSLFLILLRLFILRRNFHLEHLLQIPISILFGYFIDISMILLNFVNPELYLMKIVYLLIGCLVLGFGVYTEVLANVAMLPGESFVRAIVTVWHTEFGITKVCFDASMTIAAAVLSIVFFRQLNGVREGTIIAALLVGFIARQFGRILSPLESKLFPAVQTEETVSEPAVSRIPSPKDAIFEGESKESGLLPLLYAPPVGNRRKLSPDTGYISWQGLRIKFHYPRILAVSGNCVFQGITLTKAEIAMKKYGLKFRNVL